MGEQREEFSRIAIPSPVALPQRLLAGKMNGIQSKRGCFREKEGEIRLEKHPMLPKLEFKLLLTALSAAPGAPSAPESRLESAGKSHLPSPRAGARAKNIPRNDPFPGSLRKSWELQRDEAWGGAEPSF